MGRLPAGYAYGFWGGFRAVVVREVNSFVESCSPCVRDVYFVQLMDQERLIVKKITIKPDGSESSGMYFSGKKRGVGANVFFVWNSICDFVIVYLFEDTQYDNRCFLLSSQK